MNDTMLNGRVKTQTRAPESPLPVPMDNPFRVRPWPERTTTDVLPFRPGVSLTKKQRLLIDESGAQLIQQHFQRVKTDYAIRAAAHIEDLANDSFVHVGTNIVLRKRANPYEELAPYLELMMDAQLLRMGQEFNQIASDHARTQNQIAAEVVEIDDEALRSFWDKLLHGSQRGR